jgi:hypothetical protein
MEVFFYLNQLVTFQASGGELAKDSIPQHKLFSSRRRVSTQTYPQGSFNHSLCHMRRATYGYLQQFSILLNRDDPWQQGTISHRDLARIATRPILLLLLYTRDCPREMDGGRKPGKLSYLNTNLLAHLSFTIIG